MTSLDDLVLKQESNDQFIRNLMMSVVKLTDSTNKIASNKGQ